MTHDKEVPVTVGQYQHSLAVTVLCFLAVDIIIESKILTFNVYLRHITPVPVAAVGAVAKTEAPA
jgi:hypothetical protein